MQILIFSLALVATVNCLAAGLLPSKGECGICTSKIPEEAYPWTVRLEFAKENRTLNACNGVLISKRYVLTQAYCINDAKDWKIKSAKFGEYNIKTQKDCNAVGCTDPTVDIAIEKYTLNDEIALLRLIKDVKFTKFIKPVCLPEHKSTNYDGKMLLLTGWGKSYKEDTDVKQQFPLTGMSNKECNNRYKNVKNISIKDNQLCAEGPDSFCAKSGGNPLIAFEHSAYYLVGTEAFGPTCNTPASHRPPNVFTNIAYYKDWIVSQVKA